MPTSEGYATAFLAGFLFLLGTNLMAGWLFFLVAFLIALLAVGLFSAAAGARAVRAETAGSVVATVEGGGAAIPLILEGLAAARFLRLGLSVGGGRGEHFLARVRRGQRAQVTLQFPAPPRGAYPLERLEVISYGLVGLFRFRRPSSLTGELLVRPRFRRLVALPVGGGAEGEGAPAGRRRGSDLVGTREYLPGDPARHIHWRSSRRHRRLIVKEFDDPAAPVIAIVLDCDAGQPLELFEGAVRAAASLAHTAIAAGYRVAIAAAQARGPLLLEGSWEDVWNGLARVRPDGPPLAETMGRLRPLLPPERAPLVVAACGRGAARGAGRGSLLIGPAGAGTSWEFDGDGGVHQRWVA